MEPDGASKEGEGEAVLGSEEGGIQVHELTLANGMQVLDLRCLRRRFRARARSKKGPKRVEFVPLDDHSIARLCVVSCEAVSMPQGSCMLDVVQQETRLDLRGWMHSIMQNLLEFQFCGTFVASAA